MIARYGLSPMAMMESPGTALVTGASSGIGLEFARLLAARGHDLVLVARRARALEGLARELEAAHGIAVTVAPLDLSQPGASQELWDLTEQQGLKIEVLINNAGIGVYGDHIALDPSKVASMLQLNILSLSELCQHYGRAMARSGQGWILNIASTAAYQPTPYFAAYGASKTYVLNFSEALAMELEDQGVVVSCLSPGPSDTGFFKELDQGGVAIDLFAKGSRRSARAVAQVGLERLFAGKLSSIDGRMNRFKALSLRLVPRAMAARFAKGLMTSKSSPSAD